MRHAVTGRILSFHAFLGVLRSIRWHCATARKEFHFSVGERAEQVSCQTYPDRCFHATLPNHSFGGSVLLHGLDRRWWWTNDPVECVTDNYAVHGVVAYRAV
jgi:hypothetical protein